MFQLVTSKVSDPVHLDLSELCAEQSDQELAFLRPYGLNQPDLIIQMMIMIPQGLCLLHETGRKEIFVMLHRPGCRFIRYSHKSLCQAIQSLPVYHINSQTAQKIQLNYKIKYSGHGYSGHESHTFVV